MIRPTFSEEDKTKLEHLRYHHHNPKVRRRCEVLWLKFLGYQNVEIAKIANVHHDSKGFFLFQTVVTDWLKKCRTPVE